MKLRNVSRKSRTGSYRRSRASLVVPAMAGPALALLLVSGPAQTQTRIEIGTLVCTAGPGIGALVGSRWRQPASLIYIHRAGFLSA